MFEVSAHLLQHHPAPTRAAPENFRSHGDVRTPRTTKLLKDRTPTSPVTISGKAWPL